MMAGGNRMNPVASIVIAGVVLSAAFTVPGIGNCLLRRNDISYGVYIYHMPVVNALLFLGCSGALGMLLLLSVTILLGVLSWVFVERPALSLKRMSIRAQSAV